MYVDEIVQAEVGALEVGSGALATLSAHEELVFQHYFY